MLSSEEFHVHSVILGLMSLIAIFICYTLDQVVKV